MTTNPEVLRLARRICAEQPGLNALQKQAYLDGAFDVGSSIDVAIAAIEKTTQLGKAASADIILKARLGEIDTDLRCIGHHLESTFERYDHLRQSEKDNSDAS